MICKKNVRSKANGCPDWESDGEIPRDSLRFARLGSCYTCKKYYANQPSLEITRNHEGDKK